MSLDGVACAQDWNEADTFKGLGGSFGHGCFLFELKGQPVTDFVQGWLGSSQVLCLPRPLRPEHSIVQRERTGAQKGKWVSGP